MRSGGSPLRSLPTARTYWVAWGQMTSENPTSAARAPPDALAATTNVRTVTNLRIALRFRWRRVHIRDLAELDVDRNHDLLRGRAIRRWAIVARTRAGSIGTRRADGVAADLHRFVPYRRRLGLGFPVDHLLHDRAPQLQLAACVVYAVERDQRARGDHRKTGGAGVGVMLRLVKTIGEFGFRAALVRIDCCLKRVVHALRRIVFANLPGGDHVLCGLRADHVGESALGSRRLAP